MDSYKNKVEIRTFYKSGIYLKTQLPKKQSFENLLKSRGNKDYSSVTIEFTKSGYT